jgi:hypothetical protein
MRTYAAFFLCYLFLPLFHIVFLEQTSLYTGVDAIFGTSSVREGKVVLDSAPSIFFTWVILAIMTAYWYRWKRRQSGSNFQNLIWANVASAIVYAVFDFTLRGSEAWVQVFHRVLAIQMLVFALIILVMMPFQLGLWYQQVRIWWLRRRLHNQQTISKRR